MKFNMMLGYGDYNWSIILWLAVGILLFVVIVSIAVRKLNNKRKGHHPKGKIQRDVLKERRSRSELSKEGNRPQKKDIMK